MDTNSCTNRNRYKFDQLEVYSTMIHTGYHIHSTATKRLYQGFEADEAEWDQWALAKVVGCTVVQFGMCWLPLDR